MGEVMGWYIVGNKHRHSHYDCRTFPHKYICVYNETRVNSWRNLEDAQRFICEMRF